MAFVRSLRAAGSACPHGQSCRAAGPALPGQHEHAERGQPGGASPATERPLCALLRSAWRTACLQAPHRGGGGGRARHLCAGWHPAHAGAPHPGAANPQVGQLAERCRSRPAAGRLSYCLLPLLLLLRQTAAVALMDDLLQPCCKLNFRSLTPRVPLAPPPCTHPLTRRTWWTAWCSSVAARSPKLGA